MAVQLGCFSSFAKYILVFFNILFVVVGAVLTGVGIWAMVDNDFAHHIRAATISDASSDSLVWGSAVTLIVVGVLVFLIAFFGCFGACNENPCCLTTYAVIVGILFGIQVLAGIMAFVFKNQIMDQLTDSMNSTVQNLYGQEGYSEGTESWDFMQRSFGCCGAVDGPSEWATSAWYNHTEDKSHVVPVTCCILKNANEFNEEPVPVNETLCYKAASDPTFETPDNYVHTQGCEPQLKDWIVSNAEILIGVAFGLAVIQLFGILFACCVLKGARSEYQYV